MLQSESFSTTILDNDGRRVVLEGRSSGVWLGATWAGVGVRYVRPRRVVVERGGVATSHRIPDPAIWLRLAALAAALLAPIVKRRSS